MKKKLVLGLLVSLAMVFVLNISQTLFAQPADPDAFTLEEVTVTAQKRVENLQKVPIAMDVISGEKMAETGKMDVDDILKDLSNIHINYQNDGMRVTIRGLGSTRATRDDFPEESPMVAVNIDGTYNTFPNAGQNLFDVERMEVLYGPQSTMYASNSPGGILNIVTNQPKLDKIEGSASIEIGNFNLIASQAMINVPIVEELLGIRLAAQQKKKDSYLEVGQFSTPGTELLDDDTKTVRLKTLYEPSEDFSATVILNYSKQANSGRSSMYAAPFDFQDGYWLEVGRSGDIVQGDPVTNPWTVNSEGVQGWTNGPNKGDQTGKGISGDFRWSSKIGELSVVPHYSETESTDQSTEALEQGFGPFATTLGTYTALTNVDQEQKGVEARMVSKEDSRIQWVVGVNYYDMHRNKLFTYTDYVPEPGHEDTSIDDVYDDVAHPLVWIDQETKAAFANITYPFTDNFRGNLGYRYSEDIVKNFGGPTERYEEVEPYKDSDYRVGFEYDLAEQSMLYAHWATSYRVNYLSLYMPPEELSSYTIGSKNRFLDNRIQLNASAYYYDYDNVYIDATGISTNSSPALNYLNEMWLATIDGDLVDLDNPPDSPDPESLGEDKIFYTVWWDPGPPGISDPWDLSQYGSFTTLGADISLEWLMTANDRLNLGITYLNSEWNDCRVETYWKAGPGAIGTEFEDGWPGDGADYDGQTKPYSPEWTITAAYEHNFQLGSFGTLVPQIDVKYQSDYLLNLLESARIVAYQEAYYLVNANLGFTHSSGMWSLNAYVKNATDYAVKTGGGIADLTLAPPRLYGMVASVRF